MKKILIVDDHSEIRELLQMTLQMGGFKNLYQAADGKQALRIALIEKPDLILMDVMMPGAIDGIQATGIMKKNPVLKKTAIVMLSAKVQRYDIEKGLQAGADGYWLKPFSPRELLGKVKELLGNDLTTGVADSSSGSGKWISRPEKATCPLMR